MEELVTLGPCDGRPADVLELRVTKTVLLVISLHRAAYFDCGTDIHSGPTSNLQFNNLHTYKEETSKELFSNFTLR